MYIYIHTYIYIYREREVVAGFQTNAAQVNCDAQFFPEMLSRGRPRCRTFRGLGFPGLGFRVLGFRV